MALPQKDARFTCETYDGKKNRVELTDLETKGSTVTAISRCVAIWVINGKFGVTWKAQQLRVKPSATLHGYAFQETEDDTVGKSGGAPDEDDDDIIVPRAPAPAPARTTPAARVVKRGLAIDDNEEEERGVRFSRGQDDEGDEDLFEPPPSTRGDRAAAAQFM
ncbi:MAG: hypothetical protein WDW38_006580 [Sanguina aurantia]